MSRIIDTGLEELSATLYRMGELAHRAVLTALLECLERREAYKEVREMADTLLAMADRIEDKAFELIARFQPVASDLRTIKSYMKIALRQIRPRHILHKQTTRRAKKLRRMDKFAR